MSAIPVLYIGKLLDEDEFLLRRKTLPPSFVAQQLFESALCHELKRASSLHVKSLGFTLGPLFPRFPLLFRKTETDMQNHRYIPYINVLLLREVSLLARTLFEIIHWTSQTSRPRCVFLATHFLPVTGAARIASKLTRTPLILTLTDLSQSAYSDRRLAEMPSLMRLLARPYRRAAAALERAADGYVLFSDPMRTRVNDRGRPDIVMEGMYNEKDLSFQAKPADRRLAVAHAGSLSKGLGVEPILRAFERVRVPDAELWLIGSGDMDDEIRARSERDPRIKFFGYLPREEVFRLLCSARLLVNLRHPGDEFTSYSFPSKLFEYLVSGTPVLSTKLAGIPEEYFKHLWLAHSLDDEQLAIQISRLLSLPEEVLEERGRSARDFVLTNKTPPAQAQRVAQFIGLLARRTKAEGERSAVNISAVPSTDWLPRWVRRRRPGTGRRPRRAPNSMRSSSDRE